MNRTTDPHRSRQRRPDELAPDDGRYGYRERSRGGPGHSEDHGDYPYGVGFSQSQGGYVDIEPGRGSGRNGDSYQRVRPWGPRDGARGSDTMGQHDRPVARDFRGRGPKGYSRTDDRLREDICERLTDDRQIDASDISVEVSGGRVVLDGAVDSRRTKHRVEDLVDRCAGVQQIENRLRVAGRNSAGE